MKKLALIILCSGILFGGDITISKSFKLTGMIKPKLLFANVEVIGSSKLRNIGELKDSDRGSITSTLNSIIQKVKKDEICKGGSYSINPIFNYKDDRRNIIGQELSFRLECKFDESKIENYNAILKAINATISKNPLLALPQPQISSRITADEINAKKESLFNEFLGNINNIEEGYSKILNKTCSVSKISSSDDFSPAPLPRVMMSKSALNMSAEADSTYTNAPISADSEVAVNVALEIACKAGK